MTEQKRTGSCLCGGIKFEITGPIRNIIKCYCDQCRKTSGNYVAAANCAEDKLKFTNDETLTWYYSSEKLRRGFCSKCGGNVIIDFDGNDRYSIPAGILDTPTGLHTIAEIYTDQKPDYLEHCQDIQIYEGDFPYDERWHKINENVG